jgi:hypothetical protein
LSETIIQVIDREIAQLQHARAMLVSPLSPATGRKRGRPRAIDAQVQVTPVKPKRRTMSAEGKAKIAAAQKKRWAAAKKAANPKS